MKLDNDEVHRIIRDAIAKCPDGSGIWGLAMTVSVMRAFAAAKLEVVHNPELPDVPARRWHEIQLNKKEL